MPVPATAFAFDRCAPNAWLMSDLSLSLSLACISISRQRDEQEQEQVQLQLATLLRNLLHCSYSYESCKSPRTARAHEIIEFSSKCNQAKFCTPNAFLTKVEDELGRRCRMTMRRGQRCMRRRCSRWQRHKFAVSGGRQRRQKWWHKIKFN